MNYIELHLLFKDEGSEQSIDSDIKIKIDMDKVTHITPEILIQKDLSINIDRLYGFNANITCDSKAIIVISDFQYFTLAAFENADPVFSRLKVNNIGDFFRLKKIKADRVDIENSNPILVDCDIREVHIGLEDYYREMKEEGYKEKPKYYIDIRSCKISKITSFVEASKINIEDSILGRLKILGDCESLSIGQYSEITDLILSRNINSLKFDNSSINYLHGTSSLIVGKFNNNYAVISNAYNIFENNLVSRNEEAFDLIRMSYKVRKDYDKYAHYSYLINRIYLDNEKHLSAKIPLMLLNISCGFGYKLANTIRFSAGVILLFSVFYFCLTYFGGNLGLNVPEEYTMVSDKALYSLYHSIITFATLGYGDTVGQDWITKFLSASEALLGIYSMSVIVYTLTKKYSSFK